MNGTGFNELLYWNTSQVTEMSLMFVGCKSFNQPINFDTTSVTNVLVIYFEFDDPVHIDSVIVTNMSSTCNVVT